MKKAFCSCRYLGNVLQNFCKTSSIILSRIRNTFCKVHYFKAFTLAEIMIVLTIIGVLTCILLPVAFHSLPNENVMKFKKANSTLYKVINELVNNNQYYLDGDLRKMPDGSFVTSSTYLCETIADILSTKSTNCIERGEGLTAAYTCIDWDNPKNDVDGACKWVSDNAADEANEIISSDGIVYFEGNPNMHFGTIVEGNFLFGANFDANGFDRVYKSFCFDVDGLGKGEDPFGYGIRADGKILPGLRADEWIKKSIQEKE